ncbi:hypothetical protein [Clostridium merdae]|uniref:hypothetical protein n=1 Tax=Clostridium merdae TaxID=1958780 RepID=UPI000A26B767|nr:hypothetical protein [Clostridium merdae]
MLKIWTKALSLLLSSLLSIFLYIPAYLADSIHSAIGNGLHIEFNELFLHSPFDLSQIRLGQKNGTGEVLIANTEEAIGKTLNTVGGSTSSKNNADQGRIITRKIYKDVVEGDKEARLYAIVEIYYWDSFAQINTVKKMGWERLSGGEWSLEDQSTDWWLPNATPDTVVNFMGSAVITIPSEIKRTERFPKWLKTTYTQTYYERHPVSAEFGLCVM